MESRKIYYGCGIAFESELELPGIPVACGQQPTASVRFGTIPADEPVRLTGTDWFHAKPQYLQFVIPEIARYRITNGREILIEPVSGVSDTDLRLFLTGSAFGGLLYQRGTLPLHASTVRVSNSYVSFVGDSGAGKSTQAAVLHRAGYSLAGDDICPVTVYEHDTVLADIGFPRLKLWSDTLAALHIDGTGLERSSVDRDKYDVSTCESAAPKKRRLSGLYVLEYVDSADRVGIEQITGQSCLPQFLRHTYRYCFVNGLGCTEQHFQLCMQVARAVPVFRLRRRRDMDDVSRTVELLERHWTEIGLLSTDVTGTSAAA